MLLGPISVDVDRGTPNLLVDAVKKAILGTASAEGAAKTCRNMGGA